MPFSTTYHYTSLGKWSGFAYDFYRYPVRTMLSLHFHYSNAEERSFCASGTEFDGDSYEVVGTYSEEEDGLHLVWTMSYPGDFARQYRGRVVDEYTIIGTRDSNEGYGDWEFILKKIPPEFMLFRPRPAEFQENAVQARWKFARDAIIYDIRRKRWDWKYFAARRDVRKAYINLQSRSGGRTLLDYQERSSQVYGSAVPKDVQLYESIANHVINTKPLHK